MLFASACPAVPRVILAFVEINRFEAAKRTLGHAAAAELLVTLADRVAGVPGCRSARSDRTHVEATFDAEAGVDATELLECVAALVSGPIDIDGYTFALSVRIGAAEAAAGQPVRDLIELAERALDEAAGRRPSVAVVRSDGGAAFRSRFAMMRALQHAIRDDRLDLHYQPKVGARSGETAGLEALVRWRDPDEGMIPPDRFIGLAEETGDIAALTEWVIGRAIADQARLLKHGHRLPIDVNLSGVLVADPGFGWDTLMKFTAVQGDIGFEITETAMIADPARALENLRTIADAGVKLAIDDYGSGFSSLAYLRQLPLSELKIDRMFISSLTSGQRDPLLVRSTIELAHALGMQVTAEGIETPEVAALLQVMGCDLLQGYHLCRPLPFDGIAAYLDAGGARAQMAMAPIGPRTMLGVAKARRSA